MQARHPASVKTLEIVLPHPSLPVRRRSSLLSVSPAASPRTPRSCTGGSPVTSFFFAPSVTPNRKSIDSWNSSNLDLPDEKESEWKPEQTLLLSRTLEALPPHLITPFGPVPPSNLLDKIARGVSQAKGASEWPHSLRATRSKLVELARQRAKEEKRSQENRQVIAEEEKQNCPSYAVSDVLQQATNRAQTKRPLYRQSSMDFMNVPSDIKDNANIHRLSNRLQRTNRIIDPSYHPYSRGGDGRLSSPKTTPSLSNPSSSTLSSSSTSNDSLSSRRGMLRRSASTLTSVSNSSSRSSMSVDEHSYLIQGTIATDPRVQRVRRSDSFCAPANSSINSGGLNRPFKRAPSFGAIAQESKKGSSATGQTVSRTHKLVSESPSSDEEEKVRTRGAKKLRTKTSISSVSTNASMDDVLASSSPGIVPSTPAKTVKIYLESSPTLAIKKTTLAQSHSTENSVKLSSRPRANLQRNPSIFGAELPHLNKSPENTESPSSLTELVSSKRKTLRRVRRLMPGRKISFGMTTTGNDADGEEEQDDRDRILGSAFQLV